VAFTRRRAKVLRAIAETKEAQAQLSVEAEAVGLRFEGQASAKEHDILLHEARTLEAERARVLSQAETARVKAGATKSSVGYVLDAAARKVSAGHTARRRSP